MKVVWSDDVVGLALISIRPKGSSSCPMDMPCMCAPKPHVIGAYTIVIGTRVPSPIIRLREPDSFFRSWREAAKEKQAAKLEVRSGTTTPPRLTLTPRYRWPPSEPGGMPRIR